MKALEVLKDEEVIRRWRDLRSSMRLHALYNSYLGGIVTDPAMMQVPIDDHMVHRGHAVFDTCTLINGRVYRLDAHLDRLFNSIRLARLKLPELPDDISSEADPTQKKNENKSIPSGSFSPFLAAESQIVHSNTASRGSVSRTASTYVSSLKNIILQTCAASGRQNAMVRYWMSAGPGNMLITPYDCSPTFYVLVFDSLSHPTVFSENVSPKEFSEKTVSSSAVPMKPELLANMKSTNYLLNSLTAMTAVDNGGRFGIWVHDTADTRHSTSGTPVSRGPCISECSINSCIIVTREHVVMYPRFHKILPGITMLRALDILSSQINRDPVGDHGMPLIREVKQCDIPLLEAYEASEFIQLSGDVDVHSIINLDGRVIGSGRAGPVATFLYRTILREAMGLSANSLNTVKQTVLDEVPYNLFSSRRNTQRNARNKSGRVFSKL
eukprot:GHVQ01002833.1.p1 GENE.GHVQ01002833.1~~GHVQ01002833.1.p1  ORF type:complete len:440 (-),score=25.80 GHVQ01002833.1:909-2228(-)